MNVNKYDKLLQGVRQFDNYWSDIGIDDAIALLEDFSDEDWTGLEKILLDRPPLWQVACAEALSEISDTKRAFAISLTLLQAGTRDVQVAALDTINALAVSGLVIAEHSPQLRIAIEAARIGAGAADVRILDALDQRLK